MPVLIIIWLIGWAAVTIYCAREGDPALTVIAFLILGPFWPVYVIPLLLTWVFNHDS